MNQRLSVLFYPKKPKGHVGGPVPIYQRITVFKEGSSKANVTELSTGKKVELTKWSAEANRLIGKSDLVRTTNEFLICSN